MKAAWRGQNSRGIPPTRTRWANTAPRCYTTSTAREKMEAGFVMLSCASERRASPRTRRCWRHAASILSRCSAVRRKTTARARSWRCTRSAPKFSETSWTSHTPLRSWCVWSASRSLWPRRSFCSCDLSSRSVRRSSNNPTCRSSCLLPEEPSTACSGPRSSCHTPCPWTCQTGACPTAQCLPTTATVPIRRSRVTALSRPLPEHKRPIA